jgi:hypothetical protein
VTQSSARAAKIVRRELGDAQLCRVLLDNVPDRFLCDAVTPSLARLADASKYPPRSDAGRTRPFINDLLYPVGNWNGPNMSTFPYQIYNGPMLIAPLQVSEIEFG